MLFRRPKHLKGCFFTVCRAPVEMKPLTAAFTRKCDKVSTHSDASEAVKKPSDKWMTQLPAAPPHTYYAFHICNTMRVTWGWPAVTPKLINKTEVDVITGGTRSPFYAGMSDVGVEAEWLARIHKH